MCVRGGAGARRAWDGVRAPARWKECVSVNERERRAVVLSGLGGGGKMGL